MARLQKKKQNEDFCEELEENTVSDEEIEKKEAELRFKKNDKLVKAEKKKLLKILAKIDENLIKICDSLIENIAFMSVTLDDLIKTIKANGVKEFYMNGKGQFGYKKSVEVDVYNAMQKNYQSSTKLLIDILTKDESSNGSEEELKEFFARPRK